MARDNGLTTALVSALLGVPMLFIALNVLEYEIGIAVPWNPFDLIYQSGQNTLLALFFNGLIVLGPVLGLAALFAPLTDIHLSVDKSGIAFAVAVRRGGWLTLSLIALSMLAIATLGTYLVAENLPCILGKQVQC